MERQFLVTQLVLLLEQCASKSRLCRQALAARPFDARVAEIRCHQVQDRTPGTIEQRGHHF
jgi:hypothetical protein